MMSVNDVTLCNGLEVIPNPVMTLNSNPMMSLNSNFVMTLNSELSDDVVDPDEVYSELEDDPDEGGNYTFTWPTPLGKTQAEVELWCTQQLQKSPLYDYCVAYFPDNVQDIHQECVTDIQV